MISGLIFVVIFALAFYVGRRWFSSFGWWLFRATHRNNPDALAFAERECPRRVKEKA